jgi:hypothetical protein
VKIIVREDNWGEIQWTLPDNVSAAILSLQLKLGVDEVGEREFIKRAEQLIAVVPALLILIMGGAHEQAKLEACYRAIQDGLKVAADTIGDVLDCK